MKVEHHVTIHSGLNIHAPVFAESMEEVTPWPEQLIRSVLPLQV